MKHPAQSSQSFSHIVIFVITCVLVVAQPFEEHVVFLKELSGEHLHCVELETGLSVGSPAVGICRSL